VQKLESEITELLLQQGFIAVGFSEAGPVHSSWQKKFKDWIKAGNNSAMQWLERNTDKRTDPTLLHPGTQTIISMLHLWPETEFDSRTIKIAAYAHGSDYHLYLKKQAEPVIKLIAAADPAFRPVFITDSAAVFDRYWAWKAGLGFIGKNGFLINPMAGSRVFISHIFTSLVFNYNPTTLENSCGTCTKCINSCPTQAFNGDGTIDARKCIAYYNIESKEITPVSISEKNPGWIFGCDICQTECPYNQKKINSVFSEKMKGKWMEPSTEKEWMDMSKTQFECNFSHTPLQRAGLDKLKQNIIDLMPGL